jgi:hypothetical protein
VRNFFGGLLLVACVAGYWWGAHIMAEPGVTIVERGARFALSEGGYVAAMLIAYGLGLGPMVLGMLLLESNYDYRRKWVCLLGIIPAWYAFGLWLAQARELREVRDPAFLPAALLLVGIVGVLAWQLSLWIRLRRAAIAEAAEERRKAALSGNQQTGSLMSDSLALGGQVESESGKSETQKDSTCK